MRTYAHDKDVLWMNLREFQSILIYFGEEEIEDLQAAIDKRRNRRSACDGDDRPGLVEQPVYSSNVGADEFSEIRTQDF
jgi:hypothetical protein